MYKNESDFSLGLSAETMTELADFARVGILNWHIPSGEITLNEPIVKLAGYEMHEIGRAHV